VVKEAIRNKSVYGDEELLFETVEVMRQHKHTATLVNMLVEVVGSVDEHIASAAYDHLEYLLFIHKQLFTLPSSSPQL
jgi:hypothetical protein